MPKITKALADKLTGIAVEQFTTGFNFKKNRIDDIRKNEEFYYGRKIKVPRGRFGVPLPTMAGFVDALMSKIDDAPYLKYGYNDIADLKISKKTSALWQKDSHPNKANWPLKDRWGKKLACFSGRPIYKIYAESDPKYKSYLEIVDYEDFVTEPMGGGDLEKHLFCGQDNIFRTENRIKHNVKTGFYDKVQVEQMNSRMSSDEFKKTEDIFKSKAARWKMLGLDLENNTYVGQPIVKFIEWVMEYRGERFYLVFEYFTRTWVRCSLLEEVFESKLLPWMSWATHEDPFKFWTKAPCDDIRPIADAMDVIFSQALDNRQKRNLGQRAYDPAIFPDPSELEWRPNGLVMATATAKGKLINQGIYEFKTPEITGSIDLISWLDMFLGRKSGISSEAQGAPETDKVGIYFGNLQQMADRLGLYNKSYRECHLGLGLRYAWGVKEHLTGPEAVKIIGEEGVEWEELTRGEAAKAPDLDLELSGGQAEVMANEAKSRKRENALGMLIKRPDLTTPMSPNWLVQEVLKHGSYEEAEIKIALTKDSGSLELQAEASQSIQMILVGKKPKINRGANTMFIQKILNFATDNNVKMDVYKNLIAYAQAHIKIAIENMTRAGHLIGMEKRQMPGKPVVSPAEGLVLPEPQAGMPTPGVSGGRASNLLRGRGAPAV